MCDGAWRVRRAEVETIGGGPSIVLTADGAGHWRDGAGAPRPELDGAIDVDLPMTPFTNTLPIRRLNLRAGEAADLRVVYIVIPQGRVTVDPQRYVCLEPRRRYATSRSTATSCARSRSTPTASSPPTPTSSAASCSPSLYSVFVTAACTLALTPRAPLSH